MQFYQEPVPMHWQSQISSCQILAKQPLRGGGARKGGFGATEAQTYQKKCIRCPSCATSIRSFPAGHRAASQGLGQPKKVTYWGAAPPCFALSSTRRHFSRRPPDMLTYPQLECYVKTKKNLFGNLVPYIARQHKNRGWGREGLLDLQTIVWRY